MVCAGGPSRVRWRRPARAARSPALGGEASLLGVHLSVVLLLNCIHLGGITLTYEEEKARSIIMDMNHKFCQNQVSCPERMDRLVTCWGAFGPVVIKKYSEAGQEGLICKSEREAVERCSGGLVQRLMRSATDDECMKLFQRLWQEKYN